MASRESIVNDALAHLGEEPTETLDPTMARSAVRKVLAFLDRARDRVLIAQDWLDARAYAVVQPSGVSGGFAYQGLYWMPEGALMVRDVAGCVRWERGSEQDETGVWRSVIRADSQDALSVTYTRRIDWSVIPVMLEPALSLQLAALACHGINGDGQRARSLQDAAVAAALDALGKDGLQMGGQDPFLPDPYGELRRSAL